MKKNILLIFLIITLTGCSVEYNVDVDDKINESTTIVTLTDDLPYKSYTAQKNVDITSLKDDDSSKYSKIIKETDDNYIFNYKYEFEQNEYIDSFIANSCYEKLNITNDNDRFIINTSDKFLCLNVDDGIVDSVTINITTKNKVTSNNADKVSNNTYTWYIDESNYENKPIQMNISKKNIIGDNEKLLFSGSLELILTFLIFIIPIIVLIILAKYNGKHKNKI